MQVTFSASLAAGCGHDQLLVEPWVRGTSIQEVDVPPLIFYFLLAGCGCGQPFWARTGLRAGGTASQKEPGCQHSVCHIIPVAVNAQTVK